VLLGTICRIFFLFRSTLDCLLAPCRALRVHKGEPVKRVMVVLSCLALVGSGCAKKGTGATGADSPKPAGATPPRLAVTGTEYDFGIPAEIEGGVVNLDFQNTGKKKHEAIIVKVGSTAKDQVVKDITALVKGEGAPTPDYLDIYGGAAEVAAGSSKSVDVKLAKGSYALVCTLSDNDSLDDPSKGPENAPLHLAQGMYKPFTVTSENAATMPAEEGTVVAKDYSFELPALAAGTHTLVFRNEGKQPHFASISEFPEGVTEQQARAAFQAALTSEQGPPPGTPEPVDIGFAGPLSADGEQTFDLDLKGGRTYVVVCFMSDRAGGPPHAIGQNMITFFTT